MNAPAPTPNNDASDDAARPSLGRRLYSFLLDPDVKGNLQGLIENFVACLILLNIGLMLLETIPQVYEPYAKLFHSIETVSIYIFTLEYIVRFSLASYQKDLEGRRFPRFSYAISPFAVIDLLSILPFYLSAFIALDLRVLRVLRLLRLLKLIRTSVGSGTAQSAYDAAVQLVESACTEIQLEAASDPDGEAGNAPLPPYWSVLMLRHVRDEHGSACSKVPESDERARELRVLISADPQRKGYYEELLQR